MKPSYYFIFVRLLAKNESEAQSKLLDYGNRYFHDISNEDFVNADNNFYDGCFYVTHDNKQKLKEEVNALLSEIEKSENIWIEPHFECKIDGTYFNGEYHKEDIPNELATFPFLKDLPTRELKNTHYDDFLPF